MPLTLETLAGNIQNLIRKFDSDKDYYLSKAYSEAQARVDFITPLFKALGWDVENEAGLPHHAREVFVERGEAETEGRPDYNFRLGGQTKFFVEAKAPSEPLDAPRHILQAKGYAWNTKQVFFVILTDFAEFRFYDASIRPDERNPDEGLLITLRYTDYLKSAEKLWEFSKERVAAGSLDAMLPRDRRTQRLRIPVDEAFLDEMTGWREDLARNVFKNNPELTAKQLNEVVQRLLDRIVFIRIAEDRHIIEKRQLADAAEEWQARGGKFHIFDWLRPLFEKINDDFNGEIFKPNELLEKTQVDSEVLARIIERLYPPKSPYRFDVIGVELLGSIYERYLGKTIRPTAKTVRVEEKPEVRKAGGVYYTPKYIVDYIVKNTVGKVIEGKTPKQIEKIRILDPACGSGSFLIGAFQCLIDYHVGYLTEHPKEAHVHPLFPDLIKDENGEPRLSVIRKARILRNNLFGVDIDPQAVEITMMSLYLKALEGEKSQLPPKQSLLPELKYNIICGNSLIGPDIYDQGTFFGDEERDHINAFDWPSGFPEIMKAGGFDAVIGNPPYVRVQRISHAELDYIFRHYKAASKKVDVSLMFIERSNELANQNGLVGVISSSQWLTTDYGASTRGLLSEGYLAELVDFDSLPVFEKVSTYPGIFVFSRKPLKSLRYRRILGADQLSLAGIERTKCRSIPFASLGRTSWNLTGFDLPATLRSRGQSFKSLGDFGHFYIGALTGMDSVFVIDRKIARDLGIENKVLLPYAYRGNEIERYASTRPSALIIYPYVAGPDGESQLMEEAELRRVAPDAYKYLLQHRRGLQERMDSRRYYARGSGWYRFLRPGRFSYIFPSKLIIRGVSRVACVGLLGPNTAFNGANCPAFISENIDPKFLLGIFNSRLITHHLRSICPPKLQGYVRFNANSLNDVPIVIFDSKHPNYQLMLTLVDRMLELNKKTNSGKLAPSELARSDREIASTEREIDMLVYELYGITDEERKVIEEA